ncbi:hypothetical protein HIM_08359 [Hirsutella minnesotensis 3608]|uniref:HAT C-terminal dimerisation domain-containing protein n=1 Tax=Hirsutella minnesotensis 3608 TaxID=1043627 RepID=A0A0F7ZYC2_9HYPO|nr:hypothetical protein HIM_08359 [Hirsutella minnesotensis 3608]
MASCTGTDSDNSSELTTLVSGDTPTLPGQEQPSIRALFEAQDDAAYDLAVAQIPRDHRVRVKGICGDYHEYTTPIRQSGSYVQLATTVKRAPFEEALIAFFVVCQIALRLVADELFVGFLRIVYPSIDKLLPGCGNTLRALVLEAFNKRKEHLKEVLARSVSKIHFSFDLWTSPNHLALLGVVAHFIDEFGQNQSILIAIRQLHGSHSGENQAEVIKEVIQEYNLQNRIGYFVTDNASNNNTAIDSLIARFLPHLTPKQRLGRRLRCLGHVINLSAKAFLYGTEFDAFEKNAEAFKEQSSLLKELHLWRKRGPVGKLHNIVTFICRTPQRREKFANIQSQSEDFATEFDGLKLVVDNATRWNSLYLMIERAIKLRDRIDRFCIDHAEFMHGSSNKKALSMEEQESLLKHDSLTADDWAVLTEIVAFLEKFYTLTKRAEGSKLSSDRGVLSDYLTTLNVLLKHAREYRDDINFRAENPDLTSPGIRQLRVCIVNCWTKLDEYFALVNDTPAHYAAIVTNPQMKWKYFERQWKDAHLWKDATLPESWLPGGKRALNSLWEEYKNLPVADACAGSKRARTPDEFERETDMTQWDEDEMDELETWLSMKVFKLDDDDTLPAYWLRQSKQPATQRIAKMGLDMASIPAMSSDLPPSSLNASIATVLTVLVPKNADFNKVLSYQMPEDSASLHCAPSFSLQGTNKPTSAIDTALTQSEIIPIALALARGWVVIVPDFEGPQAAFLANRLAGQATLDGIRAAVQSQNITGIQPNARVVMWGYSGGSLATGWAAELQPTYAPELKIAGAALGGLVPSIQTVIQMVNKSLFAGLLPPGMIGLANQYPVINDLLAKHIRPEAKASFYTAKQICAAPQLAGNLFKDVKAAFDDQSVFTTEPVTSILNENNMGQAIPQMPLYVYKAVLDEVSPIRETDDLVQKYCSAGTSVEYHRMNLVEHALGETEGVPGALGWIDNVLSGRAPMASCSTSNETVNLFSPEILKMFPRSVLEGLASLAFQKPSY